MIEQIKPNDLRVFLEVVQARSFTTAAERLAIPRPTVSRQIARLEALLGVRLLHRTTRTVMPTPVGDEVRVRAIDALAALDQITRSTAVIRGQPRGRLRIAAPPVIGPLLCGPIIQALLAEFADLSVEVELMDRRIDLIAERYEVAVRMGPIGDDRLVAHRLGRVERWIVGAPALAVDDPAALDDRILNFRGAPIELRRGEERIRLNANPRLRINDYGLLRDEARRGSVAAILPHLMCAPDALAAAGLTRLLPAWRLDSVPVHVLRPAGGLVLPRVRVFIERLRAQAAGPAGPLLR